jgi:pyruvate dehydrogenase E2 component (dihydrolipoamide acetyltransferase)
MATEVTLPALGESVTEGTVTRWLKQVGDTIEVDEPLLEVSTDKVDTEIPSPVAGTLLEIKAEEDDTVEVGAILAMVGDSDEASSTGDDSGGDSETQQAEPEPQPAQDPEPEPEPAAEQERPQPAAQQSTDSDSDGDTDDGRGGGDATPVTQPALGESVTEGTVTRWLKQVGDTVEVDEPLLEVSTDKVDTEIPSPVAGTLLEIKAEEDETVEVGAELAVIGSGRPSTGGDGGGGGGQAQQESAPEPEQPAAPEPAPEAAEEPSAESPQQAQDRAESAPAGDAPQQTAPGQEPRATTTQPAGETGPRQATGDEAGYVTPLVRKLAQQHGVDLSTVQGSGVGGRIRKQDVLDAAARAKQAPAAPAAEAPATPRAPAPTPSAPTTTPSPLRGTTEKISRLRKIIATRMVESLQEAAQLTQVVEVDVTNVARLRDQVKGDFRTREGVKLSYLPFFAKAAIDALKQHPKLNAAIDTEADEITYYDRENLALAVDTEKGLITPVIKDAGDLSIAGLAKKIADVAERTRSNKIGPDELSGGTFTITNLGSVGALWDTPIINKPQVAILGPGAVVKRPVVIDDPNLGETIAVRHMVYLALTYDHRLVDGADAGRFLAEVKQRLESGQFEI